MSADAAIVLHECLEPAPAVIALRRERIAQQAVNALPGGQHLRTCDRAGHVAVAVEQLTRRDLHAEIAHVEAQRGQPRDQLGLGHDPGAAAGKLVLDTLEDVDRPAAPMQHGGGQKPAHRAADDQDAPLGTALAAFLGAASRHANTLQFAETICQ